MTAPGLLRVEAIQNAGQNDEEGRQATILRRAGRRHKWDIYTKGAVRGRRKKKIARIPDIANIHTFHVTTAYQN